MAKISTHQILHRYVFIRRSGKVFRNVLAKSLVSNIKQGKLKRDDEISADEKSWLRLDQHYQLARYFMSKNSSYSEPPPPDVQKHLSELSQMLKDLDQ